jgi:hypothetical protein
MEETNHCVSKYTRQFYNFYTLWAVVILESNSLASAEVVASKYLAFMEKVERLSKEGNLPEFLGLDTMDDYPEAYNYYINTLGANTDLQPRVDRYNVLKKALLSQK